MNPFFQSSLFRLTIRIAPFITALLLISPNAAQAQSSGQRGLRCSEAITFCQTTFRASFPTDSTFLQESLPPLSCVNIAATAPLRTNGVWYKLTVYQKGDLGFGIEPLNENGSRNGRVNLDWALFRLTDSTDCGRLGVPIRCNSANNGGLTGAIETSPEEETNAAFSQPIRNVNPGDEFLLLVLNPENHRFGYTIDMGFSSSPNLTVQTPLSLKSLASPRNVCQTSTLIVEISDNVLVNAVTSGVFSLLSARGIVRTITQVSSQRFGITTSASQGASDRVFTLFLSAPIEQSERYTLQVRQTLPSSCQSLSTTSQISATIAVGPRVDIVGFREYCSGGAKISASSDFRSYFWENARTGESIGNTRTVVVPEGEYRLVVIDNNGCQASTSALVRSTTAITLTWNARGGKTSFCNFGDGSDGVFLDATPGFDRYEWFFNGTPLTGIATTGTTSEKYTFDSPGLYTVRAYVNGCESVSNAVRTTMFAIPAKPVIRRVGNYLTVVSPQLPNLSYYWVRRFNNNSARGIENGWDCSPQESGTYYVQVRNQNGCLQESDTLSITIASVRLRLGTDSYASAQNRQFDIQFRLANLLNTAQMVGATSITFTLRFNANLLGILTSNQPGLVLNRRDSIPNRFVTMNLPVNVPPNATSAIVGALRVIALIPSGQAGAAVSAVRVTTATGLFLENIVCLTPNGKVIQGIRIDTTLGSFRLLNAGAFIGGGGSTAALPDEANPHAPNDITLTIAPHPNPSTEGAFILDYTLDSQHDDQEPTVSAWLQDAFGNRIKTLLANERRTKGSYSPEFDVSDVPKGAYFLVMRTSSGGVETYRTAILSITR